MTTLVGGRVVPTTTAAALLRRGLAPLLLGVAAAVIAGVQVARPAVWRDEAASITMAQRDRGPFLATIAHVDVVHALYYCLLHLWFDLVPYSPFTLRLPSVLAAGGTAALLTVLGRRVADARAGLAAGAGGAVLPSMLWAGGEGRSPAGTALLATAATLALVIALEPERSRREQVTAWIAHSALLALTAVLFADALLLAGAHLVTAVVLGRGRRAVALASIAAAALAVVPLLLVAWSQRGQIAWITGQRPVPLWPDGVVQQWFRSVPAALTWAGVLVIGLAACALGRRLPSRALAVALPWAVLPPVLLVAAGALGAPLYWPRYVLFTAPAVALLAGALLAALPAPVLVAAVVALAAVAAPQLRLDREPRAKAGSEMALAARLVAASRSPGDGPAGIVFGQYGGVRGLTTRAEAIAYPTAFRGLADLTAREPVRRSTALFGSDLPTDAAVPRMARLRTVWILLDLHSSPKTHVPAAGMRALGLHETGRFRTPGSLLLRWQR